MRTHLYRGVLALVAALVLSTPAFAQGIVKGKVVDEKNQPVADAKVTISGPARNAETKTNNKGEFVQVGLQSGPYTITVTKDKVGQSQAKVNVTQGTPVEQNFTLGAAAAGGLSPEQKLVQEAAASAIASLRAGNDDEAITKLNDVIVKLPTCSDCYYNLGLAYTHKQQWPEAEAALKKSIELKPTNPDPYNGLANVYNAQKKFDDALAMNAKATELSATTGGTGGGNAESIYNQGVVLFNSGKYADAKVQFEAATKADPNNANAFYQLGMTSLNLGQIPDAVSALQTFLKLAPTDPKAAQVQGTMPALQQMLPSKLSIADRLAGIRGRIDAAARSAGRDPASVRLVAVSKTFPIEAVREAYSAGQRDFGENRVQEALQKIASAADLMNMRWHLLGHLQTNKARKAAPAFASIHSVDSIELLQKIDAAAVETGRTPELLIQVDLAGEATKFGVSPTEVPRLLDAAAACRAARVTGLMTLPPVPESPEDARPWFARLRGLRDQWLASGAPAPMLRELSMGMSADFEVAVQEGSTMVRVGTAIFGSRT